ncbi:Glycosyltransferase involved in cell wall bisynthesis [Marivirga sericea]|uniref:Glycosyltransferase involved in cell wall bisynthesis n=1 Tax=Marivirga sericea TaxID=1028 RepID=A0A1X7IKT4_9BACT|nr:glycosyltransferase family 4 protein [Marivirga sericea]SMG15107.1 Glycosyltransferase involved in cell wall bisynthesis [Marivirga sericea]
MNILRVVPYFRLPEANIFEKSGFSQTIYELNEVQIKRHHNVFLFSGHRKNYKKNKLEIINALNHVNYIKAICNGFILFIKYFKFFLNLDGAKGFKVIFGNLVKADALSIILTKKAIDIIHIHSLDDNIIPYLLKIIDKKKKFIVTLHFRYPLNKLKYQLLLKLIAKSDGLITVISKELQNDIYKLGFNNDISVITNGFNMSGNADLKYSKNCSVFSNKDYKYLLFAGSLTKRKNLTFLVENLDLLPKNIKLVVCGDGPLRNDLITTSEKLGFSERIIFLGDIDYADMPFFYKNADLVCVVSMSEAFGRMFIEAASVGTPTLCFQDLEATSNLKGIKGFFTAPRDKDIFFARIIEILKLKLKKSEIIDSALPFDWVEINKDYEKVYREFILN